MCEKGTAALFTEPDLWPQPLVGRGFFCQDQWIIQRLVSRNQGQMQDSVTEQTAYWRGRVTPEKTFVHQTFSVTLLSIFKTHTLFFFPLTLFGPAVDGCSKHPAEPRACSDSGWRWVVRQHFNSWRNPVLCSSGSTSSLSSAALDPCNKGFC